MNPPASSKFIASLVHSTSAATAMSGGKCDRQISRRRLKSGSLNSIARLIRLKVLKKIKSKEVSSAGMQECSAGMLGVPVHGLVQVVGPVGSLEFRECDDG